MTANDALFISGAIGAMVGTIVLLQLWSKWRKRRLTQAGARIGFRRLAGGEALSIVQVPLIGRPSRTYFLILVGEHQGCEAAFFDLYCSSGKNWNLQSAVLLKNSGVSMPRFQLQTSQWGQWHQSNCGDALEVPTRASEMHSMRLSSDDPTWARRVFADAPAEFFRKILEGKWTIEGMHHSVVVYRWGTRVSPRMLESYVRAAGEVAVEMFSLCS